MKIAILLFMLLFAESVAYAEVTDSVDRFTGYRNIDAVHKPTAPNHVFMSAFVKIFKESMHERPLIIIILSQLHKGAKYAECRSVDWLADGQSFTLRVGKHDSKDVQKDGFVIETIALGDVREADFRKIANASKVEYRICDDELALSPDEIADVKRIVELMPSSVKNSPP